MRQVARSCAAGLVALLAVSCGASRPAVVPGNGGADTLSAFADSIEIAALDEIFIEKHASLIAEFARREKESALEAGVVEARSFVDAAEELYLRGRIVAATRLLDEADRLLKQDSKGR